MKESTYLVDVLAPGAPLIGGSTVPMVKHEIDISNPLTSLRAAAGTAGVPMTGAELAKRRHVAKSTQHGAERARGAISLNMFQLYAESLGGRVTITVELPDTQQVVKNEQ